MASVLIIGAGLAGMSAAVRLSKDGYQVTVLEANSYVGGRTASWVEDGMPVETGLHRFLGFYTALPDLLNTVGVAVDDIVCWEDEVEIRMPDGLHTTLGLAPLHKPFKTIWNALGHNNFLPPSDKAGLVAMFTAGLKDYIARPLELDEITVAAYARQHGVSDTTINRLLTALTEGIFFVPVTEYSMYNLMGLFAPYIKSLPKLRVGAFMGGMSDVMLRPMVDYVTAHGGQVRTGVEVDALHMEGERVTGVISHGRSYTADAVILAVPLYAAQQLISHAFPNHLHFASLLRLPTMPAVTFQLELTEPSMELDRTTFGPHTALASFAEQSRTTFRKTSGRLSVILAQPETFLDTPADAIAERIIADAASLGIDLKNKIVRYRKVRLPHDFYSLRIGSEALRPGQETPIPGLTLAGDYTKQPYLATMEGAVVSGREAAAVVARSLKA